MQPQQLYGETGAQSAVLHALDAALGIRHDPSSWLRAYLLDMRRHMPPAHRAYVASLEAGPSLRQAAEAQPGSLKVGWRGSQPRQHGRWLLRPCVLVISCHNDVIFRSAYAACLQRVCA